MVPAKKKQPKMKEKRESEAMEKEEGRREKRSWWWDTICHAIIRPLVNKGVELLDLMWLVCF